MRKLSNEQQRIIREAKRLYRAREPLNIAAVKRNRPDLLRAAFSAEPFLGWKRTLDLGGIDYAGIVVELRSYVVCRICGEHFRNLSSHLLRTHGLLDLADYRIDYPDGEFLCDELRAQKMKPSRRRPMPDWEPFWTPEYVLDRISEFRRRQIPLNRNSVQQVDSSLSSTAVILFGSWDRALRAAGIDPAEVRLHRPRRHWTREGVLAELRAIDAAGGPEALRRKAPFEVTSIHNACKRYFGGLRQTLRAAGIDPKAWRLRRPPAPRVREASPIHERRRAARRERLLAAVAELQNTPRDRRPAMVRGLRKRYADDVAVLFGGSWEPVAAAAGIPPALVHAGRCRTPLSRAEVILALQERHDRGLPLNAGSLHLGQARDLSLMTSAVGFFDSWDAALGAAGFDPLAIPGRKSRGYADGDEVLARVRELSAAGRRMTTTAVAKGGNSGLVAAAFKHFGSWLNALKEAGVPPAPPSRKYPSRDSVVTEIRRRGKEELPLSAAAGVDRLDERRRKRSKYHEASDVIAAIRNRHGKTQSLRRTDLTHGPHRDSTLLRRALMFFGTWRKAIAAAGIDISTVPHGSIRRYPDKDAVVRSLRERRRRALPLNASSLKKGPHRDGALLETAREQFGTYEAALTAAGMDPSSICLARPPKYPDAESILKEIMRRKHNSLPLNARAMCCDAELRDGALYKAACRRFGSWRQAVSASGIDYSTVCVSLARYPTEESVLAAIHARRGLGYALNAGALERGPDHRDYSLLRTGRRLFGTWREAVEASGLDLAGLQLSPERQSARMPPRRRSPLSAK